MLIQTKYQESSCVRYHIHKFGIWSCLKLRFGESPLHQCEVMLKDIRDSKRINFLLHSDDENLVLPQEITKALEVYTKAFENLKGNRTLNWKTHLGFANIDIEIGEKKINPHC
ncbi:APC2 [Lepeophtheirus salmonis]|uniref:APC2 n=1 Tax=Lepeophtheirus salmonis TaxID=72036 RepID=A0A7R8CM04_LEPSM|nr:APC2 [Lepeophtheirus salmonis]CAF2858768.1 APC2 [Lepeophtheirus salmonis]